MCRYAFGLYKQHYACFNYRKTFRWPHGGIRIMPSSVGTLPVPDCPQCSAPMKAMGLDFKAPKQNDVRQWKKVEILYAHGYAFHSCGCNGPGARAEALRDVEPFQA